MTGTYDQIRKKIKPQNPLSWKRPRYFQEIPTLSGEYSTPWLTTVKRQKTKPSGQNSPLCSPALTFLEYTLVLINFPV